MNALYIYNRFKMNFMLLQHNIFVSKAGSIGEPFLTAYKNGKFGPILLDLQERTLQKAPDIVLFIMQKSCKSNSQNPTF